MRPRSLAVLTALALASAPFLAGAASSADTMIGATQTAAEQTCADTTVLQTASPANRSFAAPVAGVITSYRTFLQSTRPSSVTLKVARPVSATSVLIVGSSAASVPSASETAFSRTTRVPVRAGDVIGLYAPGQQGCLGFNDTPGNTVFYTAGNPAAGTTATGSSFGGQTINVAATIEPDADGDGFGDTTQDACPTQAGTQGACKDLVAPDTTITSVKATKAKTKVTPSGKKKVKKGEVTVTFAATEASTFACSIDGAAFTACSSPLTVKLKKGTHTIAVRATDTAGNVDATPATTSVTVTKAKNKKNKKRK